VQGVCKSTVVRGEDDFASGVLRVTDCHDSIVYALAPLQYASVTCCSDCTVVLGAVGKVRSLVYLRLVFHTSARGCREG
jgi:TBCC domain-containing protein 1